MWRVMRVHAASSADLLAAVPPTLDVQDGSAACGCGCPGACAHSVAGSFDALRPRTLDDILDIASGPRRGSAATCLKRGGGRA